MGDSAPLKAVLADARLVAPTTASVLITGESGTGKELAAAYVHEHSGRTGAFVPLNCAALPDHILESLLFGHRRGAFTGATERSTGLVVAADGGTLFLDEIGDMSLGVQAKLLRVLQEHAVLPVGETRERPVDLRVVAATHQPLLERVKQGTFREDLYYRLARFELALPALRDRGDDVILLARHILSKGPEGLEPRGLAPGAEPALLRHGWPGNVRELENVLFRAALRSRGERVTLRHIQGALPALQEPSEPLQDRVRKLISERGPISAAALDDSLLCGRARLKRVLKSLVSSGDIETQGTGKATRYVDVPEQSDLDHRQRLALSAARRDGRVTRKALASEAGVALRTAGRVLAGLVELGLLQHDGRRGNAGGYMLIDGADA